MVIVGGRSTRSLAGIGSAVEFFDRSDIEDDLRRIDQLLSSGAFNRPHPYLRAAFIEALIALRDLMYKCQKYGSRIAFNDDVMVSAGISDITDLIKYVRDALCHPDSENHYVEGENIKATFNVIFGAGTLVKLANFEQTNPYSDDVCFFFGSQRIFLRRHIIRALEEARPQLERAINAS